MPTADGGERFEQGSYYRACLPVVVADNEARAGVVTRPGVEK
jgi:hypothetical protein